MALVVHEGVSLCPSAYMTEACACELHDVTCAVQEPSGAEGGSDGGEGGAAPPLATYAFRTRMQQTLTEFTVAIESHK